MGQIFFSYPRNFFVVVSHFCPRFDQSVQEYIPVEINDADSSNSQTFYSHDLLTAHAKYGGLSN